MSKAKKAARNCDHLKCPGCKCPCHDKPAAAKVAAPAKEVVKLAPLDHIAKLLPQFRPRDVKQRVNEFTRAGHRSSSFSTGPGGGGTPDMVAIKERKPEDPKWREHSSDDGGPVTPPDPIVGVADPTDREMSKQYALLNRQLAIAEEAIIAALNAQDNILETIRFKDDDEPSALDHEWCLSCKQHTLDDGRLYFSMRAEPKRAGVENVLCRWCLDWANANAGEWPPIEIIAMRARGLRITSKTLIDAGILEPTDVVVGAKNRVVTLVIPNTEENGS